MYPIFIDLEASGLGKDSFPIEVAWNDNKGNVKSYLIRPNDEWKHWSQEAEALHGIKRKELLENGLSIPEVCDHLAGDLRGKKVYSDAPALDQCWLNQLFAETKYAFSPFVVVGISKLPEIYNICFEKGLFSKIKTIAIQEIGSQHRADNDVKILMRTYIISQEYQSTSEQKSTPNH